MLDLTAETPVPLKDACRLIPPGRQGKKTHLSTLLRWILQGARSPSGERVKLDAVRLGSRWMTSREALQRFAERLTPQLNDPPAPAPRTPIARCRAAEQAGKRLDAALAKI
jgi:hypothetical protein